MAEINRTAERIPQRTLKLLLIASSVWLLAIAYRLSGFNAWIEEQTAFPLYFRAREAAGLAPTIDHRLKLFSFDDSTFAQLGRAELHLNEWFQVLSTLAARRPRAIFIDKIFGSVPYHPGFEAKASAEDKDEARKLISNIANLSTPLITAAFIRPTPIKRDKFALAADVYQLKNYFDSPLSMVSGFPAIRQRHGWNVYGPASALQIAFQHAGHTLNGGHGRVEALVSLAPNTVMPHFSLLGDKIPKINHGKLMLDQTEVPLNRTGEMIPNFTSIPAYYQKNWRIYNLIQSQTAERTAARVMPDDFVLIIPASFTGHADFTNTPVGPMPGAFVMTSILNSRLTGSWLSEDSYTGLIEAFMIILAAGLYLPSSAHAILLLVGTNLILFAASIAIFIFGSHIVSLSSALFAFNAMGLCTIALKSRIVNFLKNTVVALRSENMVLRNELQEAAAIANVLLPSRPPQWPGLKVSLHHQPLTTTSGDWYTFEASADQRFLHFILCDITGHGAQAAIIVSTCKSVLSVMTQTEKQLFDTKDFLIQYATRLNLTLCKNGFGKHTTTFLGVTFDRKCKTISVVCAANPRPILLKSGSSAEALGHQCSLLGYDANATFSASLHNFDKDDIVLVCTDGVVVPRRLLKVEKIVRRLSHHQARVMARHVVNALNELLRRRLTNYEPDDACLAIFTAQDNFDITDSQIEKAA